jgi:hypothetical protein
MIFGKIVLKNQKVNADIIEDVLQICYEHMCFSTFPYIMYGIQSSEDTLNNYNSGNCIALSLFIKKYLKNIGVDSHLIPASVPDIHKVPGVNHICHVSLLIPYATDRFYVVDPAFYFLTPIDCHLNNNVLRCTNTMDIHAEKVKKLNYLLSPRDNFNQHDFQVTCHFDDAPHDTWHYYVQEVGLQDADKYIGAKFMEMKPEPFIVKTGYDAKTNTVKKMYHIKQRTDAIVIIKNNQEVYAGPITHIPKALQKELNVTFYKYFNMNSFNQ